MTKRILIWATLAVIVIGGLIYSLLPRPILVDLVAATRGPMMQTLGDEGETRVVDIFVVSSPTAGRLRRIEWDAGDPVVAGTTVVAEIEPTDPDLLDPRTEAEARAQLSAAESAASLAQAELEKAEAELKFASVEVERARKLAKGGTIPTQDLDAAERAFKTCRAATGVAQATLLVRRFELERVQAQLLSPEELQNRREDCDCLALKSPVDGKVLRILRESEGFVNAGEGLLEIGDAERLEIVVDLLSMDAVKVQSGQSAFLENWGGEGRIEARVRRVEPFGFTKVSALGIEEQRVNVVLDISSPRENWERLGHGYQVDVRIVLWEEDQILQVPQTSLFRVGEEWAVFVAEEGKAAQRIVEVGRRTPGEAQILSGLSPGEMVVAYPGQGIEAGTGIRSRSP